MIPSAPSPRPARIHPAWIVAAVTLGALVAASAFRSSTGVLMGPIEHEFGWSRMVTSGAVTANLVIYGLVAPFAAALMETWGVRRVATIALVLIALSSGLTLVMTAPWQLWALWGIGVGTGTGAMALVFGAIIANRWFVAHRGLVMGIFSAANATGQLLFLPLIAAAAEGPGWRWATGVTVALAALMALAAWAVLRDRPADLGVAAYGAAALEGGGAAANARTVRAAPDSSAETADDAVPAARASADPPAPSALGVLRLAATRWTFWALAATFFVCGWSTNGLIQTHFVPAAHDHGMPATTAASLLAVVGIFDIVGTLLSGWLTDRVDPRLLLMAYYALRGLSLLFLHSLLGPSIAPPMWAFIVFYGLDWVATVPPTVTLCRTHFGIQRSGVVFGWVFAAHMVGAGIGASVAGALRESTGSYEWAWITAAMLCAGAAALVLTIPRRAGREQVPAAAV